MAIERKQLVTRKITTQPSTHTQRMASSEQHEEARTRDFGTEATQSTQEVNNQKKQPKPNGVGTGRGGYRQGGGRPQGAVSKITQQMVAQLIASNNTPVDFMLHLMQDTTQTLAFRLDAAKNVAPYIHPRLASTVLSGDASNPLHMITTETRLPKDPQAAADAYKKILG